MLGSPSAITGRSRPCPPRKFSSPAATLASGFCGTGFSDGAKVTVVVSAVVRSPVGATVRAARSVPVVCASLTSVSTVPGMDASISVLSRCSFKAMPPKISAKTAATAASPAVAERITRDCFSARGCACIITGSSAISSDSGCVFRRMIFSGIVSDDRIVSISLPLSLPCRYFHSAASAI